MRQDNYFNDMEVLHYALTQAENEILNYIHQDSVPGRFRERMDRHDQRLTGQGQGAKRAC